MNLRYPTEWSMEYRNEFDNGFNLMVTADGTFEDKIELDIAYVNGDLETDESVGILVPLEAAVELASMLMDAVNKAECITEDDIEQALNFYKSNAYED